MAILRSLLADAELVQTVVQGGPQAHQAFAILVTRHEGMIRRLLLYLTRNPTLSDDLALDAFLTAWQNLASLREPKKFAGWLKTMAYRKFLHAHRRRQLENDYAQASAIEASDEGVAWDNELDTGELQDLERRLSECSADEREILVLVYGFGFTIREVAAAREVTEGTLKSQLHRARNKLKTIWENADERL